EAARSSEVAAAYSFKADQIARQTDRRLQVSESDHQLRAILTEADVAVAALEETAFLLSLVRRSLDQKLVSALGGMAHLVAGAVREYVGCLEDGQHLSAASARAEVESFLLTIAHRVEPRPHARAEKRGLMEKLMHTHADFQQLFVVVNLAEKFEASATALARCAPIVRDHVMRARLSQ